MVLFRGILSGLFGVSVFCMTVNSFVINDDNNAIEHNKLDISVPSTELSTVDSTVDNTFFWNDLNDSIEEGMSKTLKKEKNILCSLILFNIFFRTAKGRWWSYWW